MIGDGNALIGQILKAFKVLDLLPDLAGLCSGHTLAELFTFVKPLQDKVGALSAGHSGPLLGVNLAAEAATAEAVDGLKLGQKRVALGSQLIDFIRHGMCCLYTDTTWQPKKAAKGSF